MAALPDLTLPENRRLARHAIRRPRIELLRDAVSRGHCDVEALKKYRASSLCARGPILRIYSRERLPIQKGLNREVSTASPLTSCSQER